MNIMFVDNASLYKLVIIAKLLHNFLENMLLHTRLSSVKNMSTKFQNIQLFLLMMGT